MKHNNLGLLKAKPDPAATLAASIAEKVKVTLVSIAYSQAYVALIAAMFCASILVVGLYPTANRTTLFGWYAFFSLVCVFRYLLTYSYERRVHKERKVKLWHNFFIGGALIGGFCWGICGILLYSLTPNVSQTIVMLVLAGITAGAVPILSAVLPAALGFVILSLSPLIFNLLYHQINLICDSVLMVYMVYLMVICKKTHTIIKSSVSLQFENHALLNNLSEAKNQLEVINKKLEKAATHDPLTNVANRNLFISSFGEAIERTKTDKKILALLYIDIDDFKNVNDEFGHHIGDQLLLILTERLEEFVDSVDEISRLGGDEFTLTLEGAEDPQEVAKIAKKICGVVAEPFKINNIELKITASIGIGVYPIDGDDAEKLLAVADKAMYYVKEHGGNNIRFNVTLLTD